MKESRHPSELERKQSVSGESPTEPQPRGAPAGALQPAGLPVNKAGGFAVASLVLGIVSVTWGCCASYLIVAPVLALVFGIKELKAINAGLGAEEGRSMAIAGIITGSIGLLIALAVIIFYIIYFVILGVSLTVPFMQQS